MKKIISTVICGSALLFAPLFASADTASSTDFSHFSGLQMPSGNSTTTPGGGLQYQDPGLMPAMTQYPNGPRLIKLEGSTTVYWVSANNFKLPMITRNVFLSYKNKDADVQTVTQDEMNFYADAKFIRLMGNATIYFIKGGTKQAIPSSIWNSSGEDAAGIIDVNKTEFASYKTGVKVKSVNEILPQNADNSVSQSSQSQLTVTMDLAMANLSVHPGESVEVTGTIENNSMDTIYLNGIGGSLGSLELTMDNIDFFTLVPSSFKPGESYAGPLFAITASQAAAPGNYSIHFHITGGKTAKDSQELTSQNLNLTVN